MYHATFNSNMVVNCLPQFPLTKRKTTQTLDFSEILHPIELKLHSAKLGGVTVHTNS